MATLDPTTTIPTVTNPTTGVTPVSNSSLQPASPVTMPQVSTTTAADQAALGSLTSTNVANTQSNLDQANQAVSSEVTNQQSLLDQLSGREAYQQQLAQDQNLPALQKQESDLRSTSMMQTAQFIQGIKNIDAKNISQGERSTAQQEAQRQNGIDALLTNAQLSFTQGQIQASQAQIKAAVDLKYNPIEQKIANSDKVLSRLDAVASKADAKAIAAAKERNDQLKADIAEKKANDTKVQQMILEATPFAPPELTAKAMQMFKDGKSPLEVATALGKYGGDYMKTLLLKEQIESQKSQRATDAVQRAKAYQDIAESKQKMNMTTGNVAVDPTTGKSVYLDPKVTENPTFKLAQALTPVKTAIQAYKDAITKYGAYEMADPTGRGAIKSTYGNALAAWKTMAGLGALSGADFTLAENAIPEPAIFSRNDTSKAKLDNSLANASSQIGTYVNTLKTAYPNSASGIDATINMSAEKPFVPTGNKAADDYFMQSSRAFSNVNSTLSTPSAMTAGYTDNQKK